MPRNFYEELQIMHYISQKLLWMPWLTFSTLPQPTLAMAIRKVEIMLLFCIGRTKYGSKPHTNTSPYSSTNITSKCCPFYTWTACNQGPSRTTKNSYWKGSAFCLALSNWLKTTRIHQVCLLAPDYCRGFWPLLYQHYLCTFPCSTFITINYPNMTSTKCNYWSSQRMPARN